MPMIDHDQLFKRVKCKRRVLALMYIFLHQLPLNNIATLSLPGRTSLVVAGLDVALRPLRWITKLKVDPLYLLTCNERRLDKDSSLIMEVSLWRSINILLFKFWELLSQNLGYYHYFSG